MNKQFYSEISKEQADAKVIERLISNGYTSLQALIKESTHTPSAVIAYNTGIDYSGKPRISDMTLIPKIMPYTTLYNSDGTLAYSASKIIINNCIQNGIRLHLVRDSHVIHNIQKYLSKTDKLHNYKVIRLFWKSMHPTLTENIDISFKAYQEHVAICLETYTIIPKYMDYCKSQLSHLDFNNFKYNLTIKVDSIYSMRTQLGKLLLKTSNNAKITIEFETDFFDLEAYFRLKPYDTAGLDFTNDGFDINENDEFTDYDPETRFEIKDFNPEWLSQDTLDDDSTPKRYIPSTLEDEILNRLCPEDDEPIYSPNIAPQCVFSKPTVTIPQGLLSANEKLGHKELPRLMTFVDAYNANNPKQPAKLLNDDQLRQIVIDEFNWLSTII